MNSFQRISTRRGFTLLLASLIASIMIILGGAMYTLAQKQVLLSSIGRDSQFAFYAADGAAECALYYDVRQTYFSATAHPETIECDLQTVTVTKTGSETLPVSFSFQYNPNGDCAKVTVTKSNTNPKTVIEASGYNVTCDDISISDRALERTVELRY